MYKLLIPFTLSLLSMTSFSSAAEDGWRSLDPKKTVLMELPHGRVVIELAPQFSPNHVEQFINLTKKKHYDGNKFYRVIDGFVAQAGPADGSYKDQSVSLLKIEGEWATNKSWKFTKIQDNDLFAEQTGFKDGFALAHNPSESKAWMTHCPGVIAMARSNEPDTASSHFYIVNGQAPRYLDRIMTVFGRVVYGMNHVQAIQRTSVIKGEKPISVSKHTPIDRMRMMSDVPEAEQITVEVQDTESEIYAKKIADRKARPGAFFYKKPPPVLDICQTPVSSRLVN